MKNRYMIYRDGKKLIVNEQEGGYNIIVLSDEVSTDDHGEYIRLCREDLMDLCDAISDMGEIGEVDDKNFIDRYDRIVNYYTKICEDEVNRSIERRDTLIAQAYERMGGSAWRKKAA